MLTKEQFRERLLRDSRKHKKAKAKETERRINEYVIETVVKCKKMSKVNR